MKNIPKIGLALSSGNWRGLAHLGVIQSLCKHNIPITHITGCSAGALIGGMYAALGDISQVIKILEDFNYHKLFSVFLDPDPRKVAVKGHRLIKTLETYLNGINIEDLDIKFAALTADMLSGQPVLIDRGNLACAIRASCAVPALFCPVEIENYQLVDGGAVAPIPVEACRQVGAEYVIAVNLYNNLFPVNNTTGVHAVINSIKIMMQQLAANNCKQADITIYPEIREAPVRQSLNKFLHGKKTIKAGEIATQEKISQIKYELLGEQAH